MPELIYSADDIVEEPEFFDEAEATLEELKAQKRDADKTVKAIKDLMFDLDARRDEYQELSDGIATEIDKREEVEETTEVVEETLKENPTLKIV